MISTPALIDSYTKPFWSEFITLPGKDFRDITYEQAIYREESYYYCVASVADREYMYGYPLLTSPTCPGIFCGAKQMTNAEFVQVIINIAKNYISDRYTTNWSTIEIRLAQQPT